MERAQDPENKERCESSLVDLLIDQEQAAKYKCTICKGLLVKAQQASCGHRFCSRCVSDLLMKPPPICPEDNALILKTFRDAFADREIQSLQVCCCLSGQDGDRCLWQGQLQLLEEHKTKCSFGQVACSNVGCQQVVLRQNLSDHLRNNCPHRNISCPRCRTEVASSHYEEHRAECVGEDMQHQLRSASRPRHSFVRSEDCCHHNNELCECVVVCQFCKLEIPSRSKMDHESECPHFATCCPNGCTSAELLRQSIDDHLKTCPNQVVQCFYRKYGCKFQAARCEHAAHIKEEQDYHLRLASKLASQNQEKTKSLAKENRVLSHKCAVLEKRISQLSTSMERLGTLHDVQKSEVTFHQSRQDTKWSNGVLVWKVSDFMRRREDATSGKTTSLYSPPFYTSPAGYKVCARLYPNGDGVGRGTHVSLFFAVMKGEYDALLPWPFQEKVTLILLDQNRSTPRDVVETFRPDPSSSSFQRPKNDMNIASGCPLFVTLAMLSDSSHLCNDTLYLKVIVHPNSPQPPEKS